MESKSARGNPLAILPRSKKQRLYTLEEYLRKEAQSTEKHEYFNGKITKMPYARGPHNEIAANVIAAFKTAFKPLKKTYRIFSSDQKIYFPELNYGAYADTLVVSESPQYFDDQELLLINPLIVVEILSKSTQAYDRVGKFDAYKTLPSFQEYVLIRQDRYEVETRFREEPNLWRETLVRDAYASITLQSVDISLSLADIYEHIRLD
ncbi:MAG: Uma2 family endonuclease [Saprospiraceae bacterium]|nr:Uma2 family endonuclease [Saprospiraceae bacterium]